MILIFYNLDIDIECVKSAQMEIEISGSDWDKKYSRYLNCINLYSTKVYI